TDFDGDGVPDFAVSSPSIPFTGAGGSPPPPSRVFFFSASAQALSRPPASMRSHFDDGTFGSVVGSVGDVDHDGHTDVFLVEAGPMNTAHAVAVYHYSPGALAAPALWRVTDPFPRSLTFGRAVVSEDV